MTVPGQPSYDGASGWNPPAGGEHGQGSQAWGQPPSSDQQARYPSYPQVEPPWGQPPAPPSAYPAYGTAPVSYPPPMDSNPYGAGLYPAPPAHAGYLNDRRYDPSGELISPKSRTVASLLSFFLGGLGVDRFYLGNIGMGVAKLLLGWLTLGIWPLIDFIVIVAGSAHDGQGARVRNWE